MDRLKWSTSFEIGVDDIDSDHRNLFVLARAIDAGLSRRDAALTAALVQKFIDGCEAHFAREEQYLRRAGYPQVDSHRHYHAVLLDKAKALREVCDAKSDPTDAHRCYDEVIAFLIDDVVRGDMMFKSFLDDRGLTRQGH